ncbi:hypothetical protein [Amycolatopsis sp. CB00013]|uniref:hypothetical protein n=1 Tax=Amycolatopsis sp. CB00013 TaxID=1703945 RepID=UPI00093DF0FD|nr:hypothetical protein [Amycolatopsis sp. CB00013]OKJ98386.1 hypothetical protein AMK34_15995 [Amycolatopsis sp. CB00013]
MTFPQQQQQPFAEPPWVVEKRAKKKKRLFIGFGVLAGVMVLTIATVVVVGVVVANSDKVAYQRLPGGPDEIARAYADAVETRDPVKLTNVDCAPSAEYPASKSVAGFAEHGTTVMIGARRQNEATRVSFDVEIRRTDAAPDPSILWVTQEEGGSWCVGLGGTGLPA